MAVGIRFWFQHQHNLSIQGGNATTSYNLSVGYRNQEGMTAKRLMKE